MVIDSQACVGDAGVTMALAVDEKLFCGRWTVTETRAHFDEVRMAVNISIYRHDGPNLDSPMDFLVLSRMEELFEAHRAAVSTSALLDSHLSRMRDLALNWSSLNWGDFPLNC